MSDTFDITLTEGGAIKGKNATVKSIESIEGGNRVTFEWEENDGTKLTHSIDVMDGEKGEKGEAEYINFGMDENGHLIEYGGGSDDITFNMQNGRMEVIYN